VSIDDFGKEQEMEYGNGADSPTFLNRCIGIKGSFGFAMASHSTNATQVVKPTTMVLIT